MEDPQTVGFSYLTWAQCWMIFRFSIVGTPYFDWLNHAKFSLLLDMRNPFNPTKSIVSMNINIYIYNYIYIYHIHISTSPRLLPHIHFVDPGTTRQRLCPGVVGSLGQLRVERYDRQHLWAAGLSQLHGNATGRARTFPGAVNPQLMAEMMINRWAAMWQEYSG